jgi:hypothetical protein
MAVDRLHSLLGESKPYSAGLVAIRVARIYPGAAQPVLIRRP